MSDDTTCADRLSWSENVLSYKATGGLQIGRARTAGAWGEYWPGAVDDVWAFQGALSDSQRYPAPTDLKRCRPVALYGRAGTGFTPAFTHQGER
ncbi:hypothetical protein PV755_27125 [Streptomyces caniscabiei]|uniref:Uncharacterized protein n=1 Tax=Streptomyces caniscabiei TaxID=2746961 RepID=A0A927L4V5_9ACTN|nr:hypothetical protein [Streptomyces caniscabiei]MBD9726110.1 hypothetical protein [Streptomyces caniscabiei]MDX3512559.1 hypothetical protein [Streptomyces caniscabiei]MDX3721634.1 hypothetical protein [Streptomyces caniscabiei]WEO28508.1 hypothetical protein IHE65_38030 [Streptomyces caniscabiei]